MEEEDGGGGGGGGGGGQYRIRRLIVRSRKASKARYRVFKSSYRFVIWQAVRQQFNQDACRGIGKL